MYDNDYLFVLKKDNYETKEEVIKNDLWLHDSDTLNFHWSGELKFNNEEVKICNNFRKKLCYLYAVLHEDTYITNVVKSLLPEVTDVKLPTYRYGNGYLFKKWQEKYGFTIEEYLTNKKYVVISDSTSEEVAKLADLGLFDWDNIEYCSWND